MAVYGAPVANGAFEQLWQGLGPGISALSQGLQQRNQGLWADYHLQRQEQIKHSQEVDNANTLLALNPDLKEHLDAAGIDPAHVGYPAAVQYLHSQKQLNLPIQRQAIKDAADQAKSNAIGDMLVRNKPTTFGQPVEGTTGLAETVPLAPQGVPPSSMLALLHEQISQGMQGEREQVATQKAAQAQADKEWYQKNIDASHDFFAATNAGWPGKQGMLSELSKQKNDPVFQSLPTAMQRELQGRVIDKAHEDAVQHLALHAADVQSAKEEKQRLFEERQMQLMAELAKSSGRADTASADAHAKVEGTTPVQQQAREKSANDHSIAEADKWVEGVNGLTAMLGKTPAEQAAIKEEYRKSAYQLHLNAGNQLPTINTEAELTGKPSGFRFIGPDGKTHTVP